MALCKSFNKTSTGTTPSKNSPRLLPVRPSFSLDVIAPAERPLATVRCKPNSCPALSPKPGASTPTPKGGKGVASSDYEFPQKNIVFTREIGAGRFGTVYEVRMGGMVLAAKKISCTVASEREAIVTMCRREFRALKKVMHMNIVKIIGVSVDDPKSVLLLMELAPLGR